MRCPPCCTVYSTRAQLEVLAGPLSVHTTRDGTSIVPRWRRRPGQACSPRVYLPVCSISRGQASEMNQLQKHIRRGAITQEPAEAVAAQPTHRKSLASASPVRGCAHPPFRTEPRCGPARPRKRPRLPGGAQALPGGMRQARGGTTRQGRAGRCRLGHCPTPERHGAILGGPGASDAGAIKVLGTSLATRQWRRWAWGLGRRGMGIEAKWHPNVRCALRRSPSIDCPGWLPCRQAQALDGVRLQGGQAATPCEAPAVSSPVANGWNLLGVPARTSRAGIPPCSPYE